MDILSATNSLSALAQPTRLEAFRLLVRKEPEGLAAGELARQLGVPQNTLSSHLAILAQVKLVTATRQGRSINYRADLEQFHQLALYLLQDCCNGRPEVCAPLMGDLAKLTIEREGSCC